MKATGNEFVVTGPKAASAAAKFSVDVPYINPAFDDTVYTSGDEAELFLNGRSLGRKKKEQFQYRLRWDEMKYEPGELKVVTYKNGKRWADDVVRTTGPAAGLSMARFC